MARISFTQAKLKSLLNEGSVDGHVQQNAPDFKNRRIGFTDMKLSQNEMPFEKEVLKEKVQQKPALKDSILFKTDIEYEEYLYTMLEMHGLFTELYEHFKVFLKSKADVVGLEKIWKFAEDLDLGPCELLLEKADVLRQISRMDLAYVYLEQASRQYSDNPMVNYGMAMYYKLNRDYELAMHWMQKWLAIDGSNPEVYYQMGSTYNRIGMTDLAVQKLRECIILAPNHLAAKSLIDKIS
jgi:tetratricopeptide (TPR) repeat protein